jgi:3-hydroxyacyl-[acyl-carrier-protein] dehydratase
VSDAGGGAAPELVAPLDSRAIERLLPHRYPFLLVDRVVELDDDRIVAIKNVTINEPFFQGHFPGHPIMPGVLLIEAMAQAGGILAMRTLTRGGAAPSDHVIYFMAIDKAKFRKPVVPGDQVKLEVVPLRKGGAIWKMAGKAIVEGAVAAEAEFLATVAKK